MCSPKANNLNTRLSDMHGEAALNNTCTVRHGEAEHGLCGNVFALAAQWLRRHWVGQGSPVKSHVGPSDKLRQTQDALPRERPPHTVGVAKLVHSHTGDLQPRPTTHAELGFVSIGLGFPHTKPTLCTCALHVGRTSMSTIWSLASRLAKP
jgi:hypothetical protein